MIQERLFSTKTKFLKFIAKFLFQKHIVPGASVILHDLIFSEYKPANSHAIILTLLGLYSFINL